MKTIKHIKSFIPYIFLFCLFLIWQLFYNNLFCDYLWSYGFSYNISKGLIPYQDFNMIVSPFTSILFSLPLFLFSGIHVFAFFYSFILTFICYLMFKLYDKKAWLLLILIFVPCPLFIFTCNYNLVLYLFFLLILYFEKKDSLDFFIGVICALAFFTKQSVGLFFIICSLFLAKNCKDRVKRLLGIICVSFFFLCYFLINGNLYSFIDMCFLGMFNFSVKNKHINIIFFFVIFLFIYVIKRIRRDRDFRYFYVLSFLLINYPMFDFFHFLFSLMTVIPLFKWIPNHKIYTYIFSVLIFFLTVSLIFDDFKGDFVYPNDISNFEYYYLPKYVVDNVHKVSDYIENTSSRVVFITAPSYFYKIVNDLKVEKYLDLLNYGNMGKEGSLNAILEIESYPTDTIFLVDDLLMKENLKKGTQLDKNVLDYFYANSYKIGTLENFTIYKFEK